jgi:hypothetical protein
LHPTDPWQRRYEALRASFVDRSSAASVGARFGFTPAYVNLLRHLFKTGKIDFGEPPAEGQLARRVISPEIRDKIREWRKQKLSAGDIAELLSRDSIDISIRTIERVLAEEGFSRLPRRTALQIGKTVDNAQVPPVATVLDCASRAGERFESAGAGVFLFAPFLAQLDIVGIVADARLPGTKALPAANYLLSFIALKVLGNERFAHVGDHAFDRGLGFFAGLNVLPKCTAMSTYSYGLDEVHIHALQAAFMRKAIGLGLCDGKTVNLDFHSIPHFGDQSVLEKHWTGARNKGMKGALTLFAQDADTKLLLYTAADIRRSEADDQVLAFVEFWKKVWRGNFPKLVFDSRFTSYKQLSQLNKSGIKFITLRRRGVSMLKKMEKLTDWKRIHIPHPKRKFPNPLVHESTITVTGYEGSLRQVIMKGNGHPKPTFLITNDFDMPVDQLAGDYARRWRVENGIAEAIKAFNLNALSSPILVKVHFDVVMTAIADALYTMLARQLRGFEDCHAGKISRLFVSNKAAIRIDKNCATITFPRRAHNPILRAVPWSSLPMQHPLDPAMKLQLEFE